MGVLNEKINYGDLKNNQKEIYNFQRVSAVFAVYGYSVTLLRDDDEFADFVAVPFIRDKITEPLWVQLKGGYTAWDKYLGKNLYICFFDWNTETWYLYPHDDLYAKLEDELRKHSKNWDSEHKYETARPTSVPSFAKEALDAYKIGQ